MTPCGGEEHRLLHQGCTSQIQCNPSLWEKSPAIQRGPLKNNQGGLKDGRKKHRKMVALFENVQNKSRCHIAIYLEYR